jgi:hypothetical protein
VRTVQPRVDQISHEILLEASGKAFNENNSYSNNSK